MANDAGTQERRPEEVEKVGPTLACLILLGLMAAAGAIVFMIWYGMNTGIWPD